MDKKRGMFTLTEMLLDVTFHRLSPLVHAVCAYVFNVVRYASYRQSIGIDMPLYPMLLP